ncbi:Uncharacterised protein [Acinetobacter baumannii]|nr:Uncharacterised protein [Acinetobacter baumannii]
MGVRCGQVPANRMEQAFQDVAIFYPCLFAVFHTPRGEWLGFDVDK